MVEHHVVSQYFLLTFVGSEALLSDIQTTVTALAFLGGGLFWGAPVKSCESVCERGVTVSNPSKPRSTFA